MKRMMGKISVMKIFKYSVMVMMMMIRMVMIRIIMMLTMMMLIILIIMVITMIMMIISPDGICVDSARENRFLSLVCCDLVLIS